MKHRVFGLLIAGSVACATTEAAAPHSRLSDLP